VVIFSFVSLLAYIDERSRKKTQSPHSVAADVSPLKLRASRVKYSLIRLTPDSTREGRPAGGGPRWAYVCCSALSLSATLALATLWAVAIGNVRLALIAILPANALLTPILTLHAGRLAVLTIATLTLDAIALPVLALAIGALLLTVRSVLLVGAIGGVARMRRGEYE
jgi:hypothetical protein